MRSDKSKVLEERVALLVAQHAYAETIVHNQEVRDRLLAENKRMKRELQVLRERAHYALGLIDKVQAENKALRAELARIRGNRDECEKGPAN